jgi:cbb3-type cytochrome oxidase maturation protein
MYYLFFIIYMVTGFVLTLCLFFWALKNGQFRDQQRARFLPLLDEGDRPAAAVTKFHRYQAYALFGLLISGLLASATIVIYALVRAG